MLNINALRSKMALFGDTVQSLAKHLGIARQSLSAKIKGQNGAEFNQGEIDSIKRKYNLSASEVVDIFFTD